MPPVIVDQPWPTGDRGEAVRRPDGRPLLCPTTGQPVRVYHDQLVVWASLAPVDLDALPPGFPLFPVVLDTGFNDAFLMQARQAWEWLTPAACTQFTPNGFRLPVSDAHIPNRDAVLWLWPNVSGSADPDVAAVPVRIGLPFGAALAPPGSAYSREKPLLGMLAVRFGRLVMRIDGERSCISIDIA